MRVWVQAVSLRQRAGMARVALSGQKVAFVVAEEGFHDAEGSGRDDLCSRMTKIGMAATQLSEAELADIEAKIEAMLDAKVIRYGDAAYAQLATTCPDVLRAGGSDGSASCHNVNATGAPPSATTPSGPTTQS